MAGLIARLLYPMIQQLETEKAALADKCDFLVDVNEILTRENQVLRERLDAETLANRTREALLLNSALQAAGLGGVPTAEALVEAYLPPPAEPLEERELVDKILMERATEYCDQINRPHEVEKVFAQMKENPEYYASN